VYLVDPSLLPHPDTKHDEVAAAMDVEAGGASEHSHPAAAMPWWRRRWLPMGTRGAIWRSRTERVRQMAEVPQAVGVNVAEVHTRKHLFDMFFQYSPGWRKSSVYSQRAGGLATCKSLDTLFLQAACLRPVLQHKMELYVGSMPHASRISGGMQTPLKDPVRAVQKCQRVYGDDPSLLLDICRELLVFEHLGDLLSMLQRLRQDPDIVIVRIKNRLHPTYDATMSAGYRDVLVNVKIQNAVTTSLNVHHHIAEVQLIPRSVYERRTYGLDGGGGGDGQQQVPGHSNYVVWRDLRGQ